MFFYCRKLLVTSSSQKAAQCLQQSRYYQVVKGSLSALAPKVRSYVEEKADICQPDNLYICDGSEDENKHMIDTLVNNKMLQALPKYQNW